MDDAQHTGAVLVDILRVLESIERKLEKQNERLEQMQTPPTTIDGLKTSECPNIGEGSSPPENSGIPETEGKELSASEISPISDQNGSNQGAFEETNIAVQSARQSLRTLKIPYSCRSFGQQDREVDARCQEMIEKFLGDYWEIPQDDRLPLNIIKNISKNRGDYGESQVPMHRVSVNALEKRLALFSRFDTTLRSHPGNDFLVVDYDPTNNTRLYRPGEKAVGDELMVLAEGPESAPWSRLILYQGMTTGDSIPERRKLGSGGSEPIPYFGTSEKSQGLWDHLSFHLQLKRRADTTNPYFDPWVGFHTVFYEIRTDKTIQLNEMWKHGPLYDHPRGHFFRKSAYTLYTSSTPQSAANPKGEFARLARHWTMLVLAPDYFYDENNTSFPMVALNFGRAQALGHCLGKLTQEGAEMNLIAHGLERISSRWAEFQSFFEFILDGGDSLMKPTEHDNLLFDDGAFSRSRRYFWAIDCLSEFDVVVSDNIVQWELYRAARIQPLLDGQGLPDLDLLQLKQAERRYEILCHQREFFRQKLIATKALRDAVGTPSKISVTLAYFGYQLFNASAVIESRASTRLGENVKLLTYVSIFFLPLAFCTSFWSINDQFSTHILVVVIIIVACATYITVFNINSLSGALGRVYEIKKRKVVRAMKSDGNEIWKQRGQRFEVFRPKHENPQPSEWYITLYAFLNPWAFLGFRRRTEIQERDAADIQKNPQPPRYLWLSNLFARRSKLKEPERDGEGWVL